MYFSDMFKIFYSIMLMSIGIYFLYKGNANGYQIGGLGFILWGNNEYLEYKIGKDGT